MAGRARALPTHLALTGLGACFLALFASIVGAQRTHNDLLTTQLSDYTSVIANDSARYERCKATHRCNRGLVDYYPNEGRYTFRKRVYRGGLVEEADLVVDFEDWRAGTAGWSLNPAFLRAGNGSGDTTTAGAHFNPFDMGESLGELYLNHSVLVLVDTDNVSLTVTELPPGNTTNGSQPLYRPTPSVVDGLVIDGVVSLTENGTEVAVFQFDALYLGPRAVVSLVGDRALALLSRSSMVIDTPIIAEPGSIGGFPGWSNVSLVAGAGTNEHGPGSGGQRVYQYTVFANATNVDEVQSVTTAVDDGQTLRGTFALSFLGRQTAPISAEAEPGEVRRRIEASLPEAGRVVVTRSDRLNTTTNGFQYNITFATAVGNVPQLGVEGGSLVGIGANVSSDTLLEGNSVGGAFELLWRGEPSGPIPVTATATEVRNLLEAAWGRVGNGLAAGEAGAEAHLPRTASLSHAHVTRTNAARRTSACLSGLCEGEGSQPGPAWGVAWTLTLATTAGAGDWGSPYALAAGSPAPADPVAANASGLTGAGASITVVPGLDTTLGTGIAPSALAAQEAMVLGFGGAGASHGGRGGIGHARHGPAAPYNDAGGSDLLGGSGGSLGGEAPWQALPFLSGEPGTDGNTTGRGGAGGGAVELVAANDIVFGRSGALLLDGADGDPGWRGGGGGSGGMALLSAGGNIVLHSPITALGGAGGDGMGVGSRGGGGGGGGRILLLAQSVSLLEDGAVVAGAGEGGLDIALTSAAAVAPPAAAPVDAASVDPTGSSVPALGNSVGLVTPPALDIGVPGGPDSGVERTAAIADGQPGSSLQLTAGDARVRVEPFVGGAEDTQRALAVTVQPQEALDGGVDGHRLAPTANNGPSFTIPSNRTGQWWLRRGANATGTAGVPASVVDAAADPSPTAAELQALGGGSGFDAASNAGSRPERVTVYVRMAPFALGQGRNNWGAHIVLHEHDSRNDSDPSTGGASGGGGLLGVEDGNEGGAATGAAGAGGAAGPFGVGVADDGGRGRGVGADAEAMVGVGLVDGKWKHGSNYRHTPGTHLHPESRASVATRYVEYDRWYKVDVLLDWSNQTYRVRIDDVTLVHGAAFSGQAVRRVGLYLFDAGTAYFDELYAGPDDTMGFECPVSVEGQSLQMDRPIQTGWKVEDIGDETSYWEMVRHSNHLSQREKYTHSYRDGLVFYDGLEHRRFNSDIKFKFPDGDHRSVHGKVWAGALLALPGDAPTRSFLRRSATSSTPSGGWSAAPPEKAVANSAGGMFGYNDWDSIDPADGYRGPDAALFGGRSGRYMWFGEHDTPGGLRGRVVPADPASTLDGRAYEVIQRGGVGACSTSDFVEWRNEGLVLRFDNITVPPEGAVDPITLQSHMWRAERPKVIYNEATKMFVMWSHVDSFPNGTFRFAGTAASYYPNGPYVYQSSFYPDGNTTIDQTLLQDEDGTAYLARTYYETTHYWLPGPIMQPVWESVKEEDGVTINFALNYHRAFYHRLYDNPDDTYLQRWRMEDKPWNITVGAWHESWDSETEEFVLVNSETGQERRALASEREALLNEILDIEALREVHGQGQPPILSRFKDPLDPANSVWSPSSVPAVKTQPWQENYEDRNIADNPVHPTVADLLIAPRRIAESRRAKCVAISRLTPDYLNTTGTIRIVEGEMEGELDLITLMQQGSKFGWEAGQENTSTYGFDVDGNVDPFNFNTEVDWETRHWQYENEYNDRANDTRNFRDRQVSSECQDLHTKSVSKHDECVYILTNPNITHPEDEPAQSNYLFDNVSYATATDTSLYEDCLRAYTAIQDEYQDCLAKQVPDFDTLTPWGVGDRQCVGGGGVCGPPSDGDMPLDVYGFGPAAPNYTAVHGGEYSAVARQQALAANGLYRMLFAQDPDGGTTSSWVHRSLVGGPLRDPALEEGAVRTLTEERVMELESVGFDHWPGERPVGWLPQDFSVDYGAGNDPETGEPRVPGSADWGTQAPPGTPRFDKGGWVASSPQEIGDPSRYRVPPTPIPNPAEIAPRAPLQDPETYGEGPAEAPVAEGKDSPGQQWQGLNQ